MTFKLSGVVLFCVTFRGHTSTTWDPFKALDRAFKQDGYSEEEVAAIRKHLLDDRLHSKKWPFTDLEKELAMSVSNSKNSNAGEVIEAINKAGGDPAYMPSMNLGDDGRAQSIAVLEHPGRSQAAASLLQMGSASAELLQERVSMMAGEVASNRGKFEELWTYANTNEALVAKLSDNLAATEVYAFAEPTQHLALQFGLNPGTLASLSLAGSFVGPMLGIMALVYAAWPEEETDPWLKVESHVAKMLTEKFDAKRRKRLGDRQRRYVKQFSRCAQAWISSSMTSLNGVPLPIFLLDASKQAKASGNFDLGDPSPNRSFPAPRCMAQLEGHMSLERDEWYGTEKGTFSGLFMPFANMHTQVLSLLADNPYDSKMNWGAALKATSAEYGTYLLDHLLKAWKGEVCRSMRLRHSSKGSGWAYQFVVYREVHQPHASENCESQCGGQSGWCDYCGGRFNGACCKQGDGGVCQAFDPPLSWSRSKKYMACMHVDCIQKNMVYLNSDSSKALNKSQTENAEACREECDAVLGAEVFTFQPTGSSQSNECVCWPKAGTKRYKYAGGYSGPVKCPAEGSLAEFEDQLAEKTINVPKVPIEEFEPCEKSPAESNYEQVEKKHPEWVQSCYQKAVKALIPEFNLFYQRFAKFIDTLAWKSGCAAQHSIDWVQHGEGNGFLAISPEFDGGNFGQCNWKREAKADSRQAWIFDETKARGWTQSSRVNLQEQHTATMAYPMPTWLHDLRRVQECLKNTASGQASDPNNDQSAAVGSIMDPVASDSINFM